ncbi:12959_t:CDS:2, partial [Funneliformis geosporum]
KPGTNIAFQKWLQIRTHGTEMEEILIMIRHSIMRNLFSFLLCTSLRLTIIYKGARNIRTNLISSSSLTLAQLANVLKLSRRSSKDSSDKYEEYEGSLGGDESNYEKEIDKFIVDYEIEFRNDFVVQILSEGELIIYVWIPLLRNAFLVKNEILAQEVVSTVFVSKLFECTYNGLKRSGTVEGFKTSSSCKDVRNTITSMSLINLKGTLHNIQSVEMGHGAFVSYTVTITC